MNWSHLRATLWLRWRILVNRIKRTRKLNNVLFGLLLLFCISLSVGLLVLSLVLGLEGLPKAEPKDLLVTWVVLVLFFLFAWMIGVVKRTSEPSVRPVVARFQNRNRMTSSFAAITRPWPWYQK